MYIYLYILYPIVVLSVLLDRSINPVVASKHRFLVNPANNCNPAIAKTNKKNKTTITESKINLKAPNNVVNKTLKAFIEDIVLKGLKTLKDRNTFKFTLLLFKRYGIYPVVMIVKSNIFHASLKYEFLFKIKPNPTIFSIISIVYSIRKTRSKVSLI